MEQEKIVHLNAVLNEYKKSQIQSEAEVRSKLLVPLINLLDYPSEFRSEEYPVYGWEGRREISAKNADYILFNNADFSQHRTRTKNNIEWVQNHSLLVVEAKKPGEMPEVDGQSMYYVQWTKAIGYIVSDGITIRGYFRSDCKSDFECFNCRVENLTYNNDLAMLSYKRLLRLKEEVVGVETENCVSALNIDTIPEEKLNVSEETISFIEQSLDLDVRALGKREILRRFLHMTDTCLDCEMRYNIPQYMFQVPRDVFKTKIYLNNDIAPYFIGEATHFYWDIYDRYLFENDFVNIVLTCQNNEPIGVDIGYSVLDKSVSDRLYKLGLVQKCLDSKKIIFEIESQGIKTICNDNKKYRWMPQTESFRELLKAWIDEMKKMECIQEYFDIEFELAPLYGEQINEVYDSVDIIYDSIMGYENCTMHMPVEYIKGFSKRNVEAFVLENKELPLPRRVIHNVTFKTCRSIILPFRIKRNMIKNGLVYLPCCCEYEVVELA